MHLQIRRRELLDEVFRRSKIERLPWSCAVSDFQIRPGHAVLHFAAKYRSTLKSCLICKELLVYPNGKWLETAVMTPCSHYCHTRCVISVIYGTYGCPVCNKGMTPVDGEFLEAVAIAVAFYT